MNQSKTNPAVRFRRVAIAVILIIAGFALCLGVYFGMFVGVRVYGGG